MKKMIALLTIFALLIGIFQAPGGVSAEEKPQITLKQAIEIAKTALDLKTDGLEFNSSYYENQNGFNVWSLSWNNKTYTENINVSIDSSKGLVVSAGMYTSPYVQPKSRIPKFTKAEAIKAAEELAKKFQSESFKLTKLKENSNQDYYNKYSDVYSIEFVRVQDGIEVPQNNISVQLDKNTLKLRNFNVIWDNQALPSKAGAFDLNKAKELFKSKLGLELTYNVIYKDANSDPTAVLAYTLKNGNSPIDAITGEILSNMYRVYFASEKSADMAGAVPAPAITPQEQTELDKIGNYITKDDAIQAAKQYIQLSEGTVLERANLYPGYNKINATWNLEWKYTDAADKSSKYINAQIDAVTKEFKGLNISSTNDGIDKGKTKIDKGQAKKLAEEFLAKVQPEKFKKVNYKETKDLNTGAAIMPPYQNGYSYNYIRVENGVPCPSNTLFVRVNEYTGEIIGFSSNWLEISFPTPNNVISIDKAYEMLFSKLKFAMEYTYHYPDTNDYNRKETRLAYALENTNILMDATSGQMLNYDGTPVKSTEKLSYKDIKGNKAEEEINILIEMGILIPEGDKYAPEAKMLQKDFVKLLISSLQEYYPMPVAKDQNPFDNYYNEAIRRKLITAAEKNPDALVTRQDAAKMIIRAMNYGVLAEKSGMFSANFKDANKLTASYKGYAVMAAELGIITPVKDYFNPSTVLTRGDAAEFLVNYLRCETSL